MIRLLVKLGQWLDKRFPERVTVSLSDYNALQDRLGALEASLKSVSQNAVHKEAVQLVIASLQQVKDDLQSFKVSLGMNRMVNNDLSAMLSGEPIGDISNGQ